MFQRTNRPVEAQALVRLFMARCWLWLDEDGVPVMDGVHWWDNVLLRFGTLFHNLFIAPFQVQLPDVPDVGFPIELLEVYDESVLGKL